MISTSCSYLLDAYGLNREATDYYTPTIVEASDEELISRLRNVKFYRNSQISIEDVKIEDVNPVSSFVVRYKLNHAYKLIQLYEEKDWKLFRPSGIKLANGNISLIVPPVIEEHDGHLYVYEGHSRLYMLKEMGHKKVKAVVVRKVSAELPMKPTTWRKVKIVDEKIELRNVQLARYIETTVHSEVWSGQSVDVIK